MMKLKKAKNLRLLWAALALILVLMLGCYGYVSDCYEPDGDALLALQDSGGEITVCQTKDGILFSPAQAQAGLIFYPGGKVEHEAYAPLMRALAERGVLCVLVEMPFNLAVLDVNAAEGIPEQYPQIHRWYIGGHSLGGSMAASYLSGHAQAFDGLVLLASYSTADLSGTGLEAISIYGDRDQVLDLEKYLEYRQNLPENTEETVLSGGNHAQFGSYGPQDGDGEAGISAEEQLELTTDLITAWIGLK